MKVEKVRVLKTLKLGENVYQQGKVLNAPLPADILKELASNSGTLEAVKEAPPVPQVPETATPPPPKRKLVSRGK